MRCPPACGEMKRELGKEKREAMADQPGTNWGKWGAEDERGTLNYLTPETIVRAAGLVRRGKVYPLAIPLRAGGPLWPGRHENWHVATFRNIEGPGLGGAEDILMIHTHGSTHMDALCHITGDGKMYNGYPAPANIGSHGARRNAIDKVGAIVTRGLLLDIAGMHGEDHLPPGHVIGVDEAEAALRAAGTEAREGDALLFRTGWLKVWDRDRELFNRSQPGIGSAIAKWAGERGVAVMAADNAAVEAFPSAEGFLPVHTEFLRNQGGYLMELFDLEALAADKVFEFLFIAAPLRIERGLGSPITPLAIC